MKKVEIYTDGSCIGNPGRGGWAAILFYKQHKRIVAGHVKHTTNNRMEMMAAIKGLKALNQPCNVVIYSDSQYLISAFTNGWLTKWVANGWTTSKGAVANKDLWQELLEASDGHMITWSKVRAHATNKHNNECDELAKKEAVKA